MLRKFFDPFKTIKHVSLRELRERREREELRTMIFFRLLFIVAAAFLIISTMAAWFWK